MNEWVCQSNMKQWCWGSNIDYVRPPSAEWHVLAKVSCKEIKNPQRSGGILLHKENGRKKNFVKGFGEQKKRRRERP